MINRFKFRFWDTTDKRFIDDPRISGSGHVSYFTGTRMDFCDDVIPLQWSEKKDNNGIDIYEGDILEYTWVYQVKMYEMEDIYSKEPTLGEIKKIVKRSSVVFDVFVPGGDDFYAPNTLGWGIQEPQFGSIYSLVGYLEEYKCVNPDVHTYHKDLYRNILVIGNMYENPELLK